MNIQLDKVIIFDCFCGVISRRWCEAKCIQTLAWKAV